MYGGLCNRVRMGMELFRKVCYTREEMLRVEGNMKYFRKYGAKIIAGLLVLTLVQSIALVSVLVALEQEKKREVVDKQPQDIISTDAQTTLPERVGEELPADGGATQEQTLLTPPTAPSASEILAGTTVIAHGMGMIDGVTTLNCLESFQQQYAQGVRVFEADLRMTSDLQVVLRHDWRVGWQEDVSETSIPTLAEFREKPLLGQYTALSFQDLLRLMVEYPDICIITDTKFMDAELVTLQFQTMLKDAKELGLYRLFDRIVVQVYSELMFKVVDNIGAFPHYILTLYNTGFDGRLESFESIANFCHTNSIEGITMWSDWWKADFAPVAEEYDLAVYVHTVNDAEQARALVESGVCGIYTDSLVPTDFFVEEQTEEQTVLE